MAKKHLPKSTKKANKNYGKAFKLIRKLEKLDINGVSVLNQTLKLIEKEQFLTPNEAFETMLREIALLKALSFLFGNLEINEYTDLTDEVKISISCLIDTIANNIEKAAILFADKKTVLAIEL